MLTSTAQRTHAEAMRHAQAVGKNTRPLEASPVFFGDRTPPKQYAQEKAWHRQACELHLAGITAKDISSAVGKSIESVHLILKQKFAREFMAEQAEKRASAADEIKRILEEEGPKALYRIVHTAETNPGTTLGLDADKELLNRLLGRPTQPISQEKPPAKELEFDDLRQQVERLVAGVPATNGDSDEPDRLG
jgi:hypothetical protein